MTSLPVNQLVALHFFSYDDLKLKNLVVKIAKTNYVVYVYMLFVTRLVPNFNWFVRQYRQK